MKFFICLLLVVCVVLFGNLVIPEHWNIWSYLIGYFVGTFIFQVLSDD